MDERSQNGVKNMVQMFARIFRQEAQNEISILLQQGIFSPVTPVSLGISQMLRTVQFDDHIRLRTKEVHLHFPIAVE